MEDKVVSLQTLRRLPVYLHYLKTLSSSQFTISATGIADALGLNDVQVRKDLGSVSGSGKPKTGYVVTELISQMEEYLGYGSKTQTVLVGAGHLGKALMSYEGFEDYGLSIVAGFDKNERVIGTFVNGKQILSMDNLEAFCRSHQIKLGVLTIPASDAQAVCDRLVSCGITAIWNFAPTILKVPENVIVENENLASSLAVLSKHLRSKGIEPID